MKESVVLAGLSSVFVLGAIAALVLVILRGTLLSLDGLTILAAGCLIVLAFSWFALAALKEGKPPKDGNPPAA